MRIYIFKSKTQRDTCAATTDPNGANLPGPGTWVRIKDMDSKRFSPQDKIPEIQNKGHVILHCAVGAGSAFAPPTGSKGGGGTVENLG